MTADGETGCPCDDELADFIAQAVDEARHASIEVHIADCRACRRFLADLAPVLDTEAPLRVSTSADDADLATRTRALFSTLERYVPTRLLGAGGMGIVYEGRDTVLDRPLALKMMLDAPGDVRRRLRREARALAQLSHPNVVEIYDVQIRDDAAVLVHELVDGRDLTTWLGEPRGWAEIVAVLVDAAAGLEAAHRAGIVHRDVTPNNIVVDQGGTAKVIDFGLASIEESESGATTRTSHRTRGYGGTPGFVAPEVVAGREVTPAADQYGLCATAYFACFGCTPGGALEPDRGTVPPTLLRVLERGLARNPRRRFSSMKALQRALEDAGRPPRRRWMIPAGVAAVCLAVGLGGMRRRSAGAACDPAPHMLTDLWTDAALERIGTPFEGAAPWQSFAAEEAERELRAWGARWQTEANQACHGSSGPSPASACLRRAATLYRDMLVRDFAPTTNLDLRMTELPAPEACAASPSTVDPDGSQAHALRARLARARVLRGEVRPDEARRLALDVAEQAENLGLPLVASAAYQLAGVCSTNNQETYQGLAWQQRGYALAIENGADRLAMLIALDLILSESSLDHPEEARRWIGVATGLVEQHGGWLARVGLQSRLAQFHFQHGESAPALEHAQRALSITERLGNPQSLAAALLRKNLGQVLVNAGLLERAEPLLLRAAAELDDQPQAAAVAMLQAGYVSGERDPAAAVHRIGESVRLTRKAYGPDAVQVLVRTCEYGDALRVAGDVEGALRTLEPAVERLSATYGKAAAELAGPLHSLALAHLAAGNLAIARSTLWRAVAILDAHPGAAERLRPYLHQALGGVEQADGNDELAAEYFRAALEALASKVGSEHPIVRNLTDSLRQVGG